MYRYYSESMESLPLAIEMGMHVGYLWDKMWDLCTSFCWRRWNWVLRLHYWGCRGAILLCLLTHFIWIGPEGVRCQPHEVWWKSYVVTDDSFLCFGDCSFVCCGFILSLFCLAVLWAGHRPGIGCPNGPHQYSALRGSEKAWMGSEPRLCVGECWHATAAVWCWAVDLNCKEEMAANQQQPATQNPYKERNHGELGSQWGQRAAVEVN